MSAVEQLVVSNPRGNTAANDALRKLVFCGNLMANGDGNTDELAKLWFCLLEKARGTGLLGELGA